MAELQRMNSKVVEQEGSLHKLTEEEHNEKDKETGEDNEEEWEEVSDEEDKYKCMFEEESDKEYSEKEEGCSYVNKKEKDDEYKENISKYSKKQTKEDIFAFLFQEEKEEKEEWEKTKMKWKNRMQQREDKEEQKAKEQDVKGQEQALSSILNNIKEKKRILKPCYLKKKIFIIGAGAAGLSAASALKRKGFGHVVILEATSQVGGRVRTLKYESNALEMGAQWIHGQDENTVYSLAKKKKLLNEFSPNYISCIFDLSNTKLNAEDKSVISNTLEFLNNTMDSLTQNGVLENDRFLAEILSLKHYLMLRFKSYLFETDSDRVQKLKKAALIWFLKIQCEVNGCSTPERVCPYLLNNYKECEGLQAVELKDGYSSVLDLFLETIPPEWIILNKSVCKIDWSNSIDTNTKIICDDGSVFIADHVIITVSLGCLKKNYKTMFEPSLSINKINAIQCTGFGTLNKIYLKFGDPFWKLGDIFHVFWTPELESQLINNEMLNSSQYSLCKDINRFAYTINQPQLLCAWVAGESTDVETADNMEYLSDEKVMECCHFLLKTVLGKDDLPMPIEIIRSSWGSNSFFRGSYSYLSVANRVVKCGNEDLAEPLFQATEHGQHPAILFAGEATHSFFYSTVHGAVDSGIREVKRILAYYVEELKKNKYDAKSPLIVYSSQLLKLLSSSVKAVDIVIIGAGVAGLTCARHLIKSGLNNIIILEALNRIGGRIWTVEFGNSILELGAQWIHGEKNMLFEYCNRLNLLETLECSQEGKGLFCTSQGEIIPQYIITEVLEVMDKIKESINTRDFRLNQSAEEVFEICFKEYLSQCNDAPEITAYKKGVFDWFKRFEIIDNACDNLQELTILSYKNWVDCPGLYHIDLKEGYRSFVEHMINTLPTGIIKKSKPVKCIHWEKNYSQTACYKLLDNRPILEFPVIVECEDGEYFAAQNVVVTSSVGFLKANMHSFFQPKLPKIKEMTLSYLGFGTVNKIFLVFEKRFWNQDDQGFQLIWTNENDKENFYSLEESWVFGITGFDRVRNLPNVLLVWVGGIQAKQMEKIDTLSVGKTCTRILRQFLNNPEIPFPTHVIRSSWYENSYMKGSYSNRPGQFFISGCEIKDLQEPLYCNVTLLNGKSVQWPAVTFAGEAYDVKYFSSVHGAMESAASESHRILNFYKDLQKL